LTSSGLKAYLTNPDFLGLRAASKEKSRSLNLQGRSIVSAPLLSGIQPEMAAAMSCRVGTKKIVIAYAIFNNVRTMHEQAI
jgi:hypothetical protein